MAFDGDDEFSIFFRLIPLGLAPLLGLSLWMAPAPPPPPANSMAFGCYAAADSPNLWLRRDGLHVLQAGAPILRYRLERSKQGIMLYLDAPVEAYRTGSRYRFAVRKGGGGFAIPFYREQDGRTYGMFDPVLLDRFRLNAADGRWLDYRSVAVADCVRARPPVTPAPAAAPASP